jgi:hypothetical protein
LTKIVKSINTGGLKMKEKNKKSKRAKHKRSFLQRACEAQAKM